MQSPDASPPISPEFTPASASGLTVVSDSKGIYEEGKLNAVRIDELLENPVAIRMVVNDVNDARRERDELRRKVETLRANEARQHLQRPVAVLFGIVNVAGVILVGLGTNLLSGSSSPAAATVLIAIGGVLTVLSSVSQPFLPMMANWFARLSRADAESESTHAD